MRKILNVLGGLGILALTTNSVVSCNLFEFHATPSENKDDNEKRPWWFPEKVTDQYGLEHSVEEDSIDLWRNYDNYSSMVNSTLGSYLRYTLDWPDHKLIYLENYNDFCEIFNKKNLSEAKEEIISTFDYWNDWHFAGKFITTNFKSNDENLLTEIENTLQNYDDNEYLVVNTIEFNDKDGLLTGLDQSYFYFKKHNNQLWDFLVIV
ncbi:hypothetical protein SCLARK_001882 [Spiroplasma clarkii]|uniref:hypothetical protein n=1 Tax=Spiroplasma clarkii TaxID=2139 RepID=UPI000B551009|nr:hypothetical protein [Spiroplasma clarkii]ARU92312.1 hypothetical protein SCLARK_001882 [Spiroplasma clarkii]